VSGLRHAPVMLCESFSREYRVVLEHQALANNLELACGKRRNWQLGR
jgi:hypothetical protein